MTNDAATLTVSDFDLEVVEEGEEILAASLPQRPEDFALIADGVARQGFDHPSGGPHARQLAAYIRWRGGLPVDATDL